MPTTRVPSISAATALAVALSAFAGIGLFWAAVLLAAISQNTASIPKMNSTIDLTNAFVGAVFGTAFTLAGYFFARFLKAKAAKKKLAEIIEFNCQRLEQIRDYLTQGGVPNFPLDTVGMVVWLHSASGIIKEPLLSEIDGYRFQLNHIGNKVDMLYTAFSVRSPDSPKRVGLAIQRVTSLASILGLCPQIETELVRGRELIKRIQGI
jgi:hypothetical protein